MEPLVPEVGWGVLHLYYKIDRRAVQSDAGASKRFCDAVDALVADDHRVLVSAALGHKADLGVMAYGPDLARLARFQSELAALPLRSTYSFVSLTELSEYTSTEQDERERLEVEEGVVGEAAQERLDAWRTRMEHYAQNRLYPDLPMKRVLGFYPMSKRRDPDANWYELSFEQRKRLMGGHARVGRSYAGRVLQLITGSTGLDDWEWGVTLLADDPGVLKDIVSEMRFDEVSARYADFGPFFVGLVGTPHEVGESIGLGDGGRP